MCNFLKITREHVKIFNVVAFLKACQVHFWENYLRASNIQSKGDDEEYLELNTVSFICPQPVSCVTAHL